MEINGNVFRDPVFVRNDDTTDIKASVVEWSDQIGGVSVKIGDSESSVLIRADDWPTLVSCIKAELNRVGVE